MEEEPEAATWALVNQKWNMKMGTLEIITIKNLSKTIQESQKKGSWKSEVLHREESFNLREVKTIRGIEPKILIKNIKKVEEILSELLEKFKIRKIIKATQLSKNTKKKKTLLELKQKKRRLNKTEFLT